jgi:putative inorganic carbon (hco3(-)) transporter
VTVALGFPQPALAVAGLAGLVVLARLDPAVTFSLAIAATAFSGNAQYVGLPIGPDRPLFAYGLVLLAWRWRAQGPAGPRVPFRAVHGLLLAAGALALLSAAWAHTLATHDGLYGLLDRFGVVPFALYALAPVVFRTEAQRRVLLVTLVALGAYLSITAAAEALGVRALVFPRYILDPALGIHAGRARGPFLEAVANGLALQACGVAAALGAVLWRRPAARAAALAVMTLCALGVIFTLTRSVWLATLASGLIVLLWSRDLRRFAVPAVLAGAAVVAVALVAVPGFAHRADDRAADQSPVWDRLNTNAAALRLLAERPLFGTGWDTFRRDGADALRQSDRYPLTGAGLPVHDVFLSHATELGLVGFGLWLAAFVVAIGGAIAARPPPELHPWRLALAPIACAWLVVAAFGPLGYALPTVLLWTWAGIVSGPRMLSAPVAGVPRLRAVTVGA